MNIYLAIVEVNYEPGYVLGAFSTKEKAEEAAQKYNNRDRFLDECIVETHVLDEDL